MNEELIEKLKLTTIEKIKITDGICESRGTTWEDIFSAPQERIAISSYETIEETAIRSILDNPTKLEALLSSEQAKKLGWVKKIGEIREIPNGAASPDAYTADGVGVSWERDAPVFRKFKEANYVRVVSNH